jgi:hypothetical protein
MNKTIPFRVMHIAFKWWQNIGDALHHFAHFGSFLTEDQKEQALKILETYANFPSDEFTEEIKELNHYVSIAPIDPTKPTIKKVCAE